MALIIATYIDGMKVLGSIVWVALPLLAGAVGGIASTNAPVFYVQLEKPEWAPPAWLFGPVWTVLYLLMGIAALLVWRSAPWPRTRAALSFFAIHLVVNAAWSWLFFHWHLGAGSFASIVLLWLMIIALVVWFARFRRSAALLLLPYLAWVTFAVALNWTLWQRNPALLL
ncbi:MAG TPA: TspO/MBR family protein [Thermoanaerobaculia bacterium]|nr:TspO/MBR family protein [Thermoanaerobaculia bacterium]